MIGLEPTHGRRAKPRRFRLAVIGSLIVSSLEGSAAANDTEFVWKVMATWPFGTVELTGFSVKNQRGIYTALHGVVGAKRVLVLRPHVSPRQLDVHMAQADVSRDVALLSPTDDREEFDGSGLEFQESPPLKKGDEFTIIGFPIGLDLRPSERQLTLTADGKIPLTSVLNTQARAVLGPRESPATSTPVLDVAGPLLPGHSGAPILKNGAVIAIANGGLREGTASHGWAIPFADAKLLPLAGIPESRLAKLRERRLPAESLFLVLDNWARLGVPSYSAPARPLLSVEKFSVASGLEDLSSESLLHLLLQHGTDAWLYDPRDKSRLGENLRPELMLDATLSEEPREGKPSRFITALLSDLMTGRQHSFPPITQEPGESLNAFIGRFWRQIDSPSTQRRIVTGADRVSRARFSYKARYIVTAGRSALSTWDSYEGNENYTQKWEAARVIDFSILRADELIAVGLQHEHQDKRDDPEVKILDFKSGAEQWSLRPQIRSIHLLCGGPSSDRLIVASITEGSDNLEIWNLTEKLRTSTHQITGGVSAVCLSPDGKWGAVATSPVRNARHVVIEDPRVEIRDLGTGRLQTTLRTFGFKSSEIMPSWTISGVSMSPTGDLAVLCTGYDRGKQRIACAVQMSHFNGQQLQPIREVTWDGYGSDGGVCFSPDGRRIATGNAGFDDTRRQSYAEVKVFDAALRQELCVLRLEGVNVYSLCFSPDGQRILGCTSDGEVRLMTRSL